MKKNIPLSGIICCFIFISSINNLLNAQMGSYDPAFGDNGTGKRYILDSSLYFIGNTTLELPDGKVLIGGVLSSANGSGTSPFIGRLLPDGKTDHSFSDGGYRISTEISSILSINSWSLTRQPDGKILQSGRFYNSQTGRYDLYIIRYLEDGTLDESFANQGIMIKSVTGNNLRSTIDLILQPDGKIVVPASKTDSVTAESNPSLFRFLPDGSPDPAFGVNGQIEFDFGYFLQNLGYLALQDDGKIIAAGNAGLSQNEVNNLLIRINPDGTLDNEFGIDGVVNCNFVSIHEAVTDIALTPDGQILVAGYAEQTNTGLDYAIAKFHSNGSPDVTFGDGGVRYLDNGVNSDIGTSIAVQPDGKILFTGNGGSSGYYSLTIFRLNEDGTMDTGFGTNGVLATDDQVYSPKIIIQSNGTAMVSGQGQALLLSPKPAFFVARLLTELNVGTFESTAIAGEVMIYPNPVHAEAFLKYELLKDQSVEATVYTGDGVLIGTCLPKTRRTAGQQQEQLRIAPNLPAGNYLLKISADHITRTVRFIKD